MTVRRARRAITEHFTHSFTDAPKFQTNHTIFFSWEGNPVNISCDVMSNPLATMLWRREKLTIPSEGAGNMRVHSAPGRSLLEVQ